MRNFGPVTNAIIESEEQKVEGAHNIVVPKKEGLKIGLASRDKCYCYRNGGKTCHICQNGWMAIFVNKK